MPATPGDGKQPGFVVVAVADQADFTNVCLNPQLVSGTDEAEQKAMKILIQPATIYDYAQAIWINFRSLKNHHFQGNSLEHQ